eukprot:TRINITY_DN155_c0_g1_i1.p1 TRINITY_DN155_c0_g1~~TRINITY_DN155_c0_g1_i1.p1  ORF type:complete len:472 (-),score=118.81 TRINITY_DN155_c0_g1_i1:118-1533(-)
MDDGESLARQRRANLRPTSPNAAAATTAAEAEVVVTKDKARQHWPTRRQSYLDSNFRDAVFNFVVLALLVWLAGVLTDAWKTTGELLHLDFLFYLLRDLHWAIIVNVSFFAFTVVSVFALVKLIAWDRLIHGFGFGAYFLYGLIQLALLAGPVVALYVLDPMWRPLAGASVAMQCAVFSMKAHSYFFTNRHIYELIYQLTTYDRDLGPRDRLGLGSNSTAALRSLTPEARRRKFSDVTQFRYYWRFLLFPTLCYYLEYPTAQCVSLRRVALHMFQCVAAFTISYLCFVDICIPAWRNILHTPFSALIKTLLPGFVIWMTMFFGVFHGFLNLIAEVVRYEDRHFYGPWWEARDMQSWWREWNCCVSDWMRRHVYFQSMQDAKFSGFIAANAVFAVSALWHELVMIMAIRRCRPILSTLIVGQTAFIALTSHRVFRDTALGNFVIWFSFIVGYPLVLNLYAFSWCFDNPDHCA